MAYGLSEYGQQGYGGSSFETGGPQLVSSDPYDGQTNLAVDATISFLVQSPASIDPYSLDVAVGGVQVIEGGIFLAGYNGTIVQDPSTSLTVTISTHPDLPSGSVTVDIDASDDAGVSATLDFTFSVQTASEVVSETVALSEAIGLSQVLSVSATEVLAAVEGSEPASVGTESLVAESASLTEQVVVDVGLPLAESLTLDESASLLQALAAGVAEALSVVEGSEPARVGTSSAVAESASLTEQLHVNEGVALPSESVTVADSLALVGVQAQTFSESVGLIEDLGIARTVHVTDLGLAVSDALAIQQALTLADNSLATAENLGTQQTHQEGLSEALAVSDLLDSATSASSEVTESLSTAEALTAEVALLVADSVALSESVAGLVGVVQSVIEAPAIVISEARQVVFGAELQLIESLATSEATAFNVAFVVAETVAASDAATSQQNLAVPAVDSVALTESAGVPQSQSASVAESLALTEGVGFVLGVGVADSLASSDAIGGQTAYATGVAETVTSSDTANAQVGAVVAIASSSSLGENVSLNDDEALVGDNLVLTEALAASVPYSVAVVDSTTLVESIAAGLAYTQGVAETLGASDTVVESRGQSFTANETLIVQEGLATDSFQIVTSGTDGRQLDVFFTREMRVEGVTNLVNYTLQPGASSTGIPVQLLGVEPIYEVHQTGSSAFLAPASPTDLFTRRVTINGRLASTDLGTYFRVLNGQNAGLYRIIAIEQENPGVAILDRDLQAIDEPFLTWHHLSAVQGVRFKTTKFTDLASYHFEARHLRSLMLGLELTERGDFVAQGIPHPKVLRVEPQSDGSLLVTYDDDMRMDESVGNPADYVITGPTTVRVLAAKVLNDRQVRLELEGTITGVYNLAISTSTPKDIAGNPIDPVFNQAAFTGAVALRSRSVFTDKGPITKPPETLASGVAALLFDFDTVTLTGASLTANVVGQRLTLGGVGGHAGEYLIKSLINPSRIRVKGCFTLPDTTLYSWEVFDPRDGQIADDPSDVAVRINGVPATVDAVIGLLGQVVLRQTPGAIDDVQIDYYCVCNPVVEIRRLNSREFRLNSWNRDLGYPRDRQHHYRYNNVLIKPSDYEAADVRAKLDQPLERELHYRAYERAYSALLNDPSRLTLNSPNHKIAYAPAQRPLSESLTRYEAMTLPENDFDPWVRKGTGIASAIAGTLTVRDDSDGEFPTGQPVFWTHPIDVTFTHIYSQAWRFQLNLVDEFEGVFTGIAVGYSDERLAVVVGFLEEGGVKKVGLLVRDAQDPGDAPSWSGGPSSAAANLDWSELHSYRLYRDQNGTASLYIDGEVTPLLQLASSSLPYLESVPSPFDVIQGAFFGSLSRPARSTSSWDFVRVLIQPSNPVQSGPTATVQYEANVLPENDVRPWTPVGYHGTGTIQSTDFLLLDATSATDAGTAVEAGLVGGDFRGYFRIEPLLSSASEFIIDAAPALLNLTHGLDADAIMVAVDDGRRLLQMSFLASKEAPRLSYGGRSLPTEFSPYVWTALGGETGAINGRLLRISDVTVGDGLIYYIEDDAPAAADNRVVASALDSVLEARLKVVSYTLDGSGFAGAFATVDDGLRTVGFQLQEVSGVKQVALHADGVIVATFDYNWGSGFHTYRLRKSTGADLVTLFVDGTLVGTAPYSSFAAHAPELVGRVSFGSSTPSSAGSTSVVDWAYCNAFRVHVGAEEPRRYVGIWKGQDADSLLGYYLPLKTSGKSARTHDTTYLIDDAASFLSTVVAGDVLVVDVGPSRGVYTVASVISNTALSITGVWPASPTVLDYRVVRETDWTVQHRYRLSRDSSGDIVLLLDANATPLIYLAYEEQPQSHVGLVSALTNGMPAVAFGAFSSEHLSQSRWDYVRYQITRSPTELRIVPPNQVLNQWNVMHSPERLWSSEPHDLTSFKSSSTGIPPRVDPDFLAASHLKAYTLLNEGTPLVPSTQTWQVRQPFVKTEPVSGLNRPEDTLNTDGDFRLNDGSVRARLVVPDDVLYSCLDVIEQTTGEVSLVKPFDDECQPSLSGLEYQKRVCLEYDGTVLPENDASASTPWHLVSDDPGQVLTNAFSGVLTYGTDTGGTRTVYRNDSPLPDHPSLQSEATFRLRLVNDGTLGTDDSQVRFGLSAPGLTCALAFVTNPMTAERFLLVLDLNNGSVLGSQSFDFLDGLYHTYRLVRDPGAGEISVFIDS